LRQIFDCLRKSGLRLTPHKCEFGMPSIKLSWQHDNIKRTSTREGKNSEVSEYDKTSNYCETSETISRLYIIFPLISS